MNSQSQLARQVELQFKKWERSKPHLGETDRNSRIWQRPIITISREPGCESGSIGSMLAKKFGFDLFGIELVDLIAKNAHLSRELVETLDEKAQSALDDWFAESLFEGHLSSQGYLKNLSTVVFTITAHGKAVIIGRGAAFLLKPEDRLAIRLVAPLDIRVKHIMREQSLTEKESREYIAKIARQRHSFVQKSFLVNIEDPVNYDLVINTALIKPKTIVEIVGTALKRKKM